MTEELRISGMDQLAVCVPLLLGVVPENSVVVVPRATGRGQPTVRVDIGGTDAERAAVARSLAHYGDFGSSPLLLVAFADRLEQAERACDAIGQVLGPTNPVTRRIAVQGDCWVDLDGGVGGRISASTRDRITAEFVGRGQRAPYESMATMRESFQSAGPGIGPALEQAATHAAAALDGPAALAEERRWIGQRVVRFLATGRALGDDDAARLVCDVQATPLRDYALAMMTRQSAEAHSALWKDLLTRSPETERAPVASLAAFGSWYAGNPIHARLALEQVPDPSYNLARLVRAALDTGMQPNQWTPPPLSEVEGPPEHRSVTPSAHPRHREPPSGGQPDGPAPRR